MRILSYFLFKGMVITIIKCVNISFCKYRNMRVFLSYATY